jgi:hypothetical protein
MENGTLIGQPIISNNSNNNNKYVYSLFVSYYNDPIMIKLKYDKNTNTSSFYVNIYSQLLNKYHYLIVNIYNNEHPINTKIYLRNLNWFSLQTRILEQNYNIDTINYNSNNLDNILLNIVDRKNNITTYQSKYLNNIKVFVLHTKDNNLYEYPEKASLSQALEEFKTLVNII